LPAISRWDLIRDLKGYIGEKIFLFIEIGDIERRKEVL